MTNERHEKGNDYLVYFYSTPAFMFQVIPVAYMFLTSKHEDTYLHALLRLRQLGLHGKTFLTDFEPALMNATQRVFGRLHGFSLHGCLIHFVFRVHEAVGTLHLTEFFRDTPSALVMLRRMSALPRLPAAQMGEGFTAVWQQFRHTNPDHYPTVFPFLMYFHNQWMVRVKPRRLSVYQLYHTTTNNVETNHRHFRRFITTPVPNAWDVTAAIQQVHQQATLTLGRFQGNLPTGRLRGQPLIMSASRVRRAERRLAAGGGGADVLQFLDTVSHAMENVIRDLERWAVPAERDQVPADGVGPPLPEDEPNDPNVPPPPPQPPGDQGVVIDDDQQN
ncbi:uncharacterized protein LOC127751579 [Frankliniella occidentalis]|uniref:Uncharacterized protein LOC127751579 n=1 Tax=Frankliniella occidentalis TaxID=133901 RepID=A0A9C6X8N4_FRAOC|nr:uncharacterized protein LOC127751579 [Frankliniella occidentalis]